MVKIYGHWLQAGDDQTQHDGDTDSKSSKLQVNAPMDQKFPEDLFALMQISVVLCSHCEALSGAQSSQFVLQIVGVFRSRCVQLSLYSFGICRTARSCNGWCAGLRCAARGTRWQRRANCMGATTRRPEMQYPRCELRRKRMVQGVGRQAEEGQDDIGR